jgi:hypothetical protein
MKTMENSSTRLAVNLGLFAVGLSLMYVGNRWLFFIGLALILVSGCFSVRHRPYMSWLGWLGVGALGAAAVGAFLWLSSCGREPLNPIIACVAGLGVVVTEVGYWRASRNAPDNA